MNVGDSVVIFRYGTPYKPSKIERETINYWIVDGDKYRKSDYHAPGDGGSYCIQPLTDEYTVYFRRRRLIFMLQQYDYKKVDTDTLEDVFALLCGMKNTTKDVIEATKERKDSNE